ncbi:hypothetical protein CEXT_184891 [Caerostris extrusa]|uniref:Uncharacterized protein n=1 Tax=Caerostris extrusa TaxID=172846 RepID=A0AAV4S2H7_CAEEX|nr:hypothetical protein CEXT_184891 [Caerostris extrusa]
MHLEIGAPCLLLHRCWRTSLDDILFHLLLQLSSLQQTYRMTLKDGNEAYTEPSRNDVEWGLEMGCLKVDYSSSTIDREQAKNSLSPLELALTPNSPSPKAPLQRKLRQRAKQNQVGKKKNAIKSAVESPAVKKK